MKAHTLQDRHHSSHGIQSLISMTGSELLQLYLSNTNSEIKNGIVIFAEYVTDVNYSLKKQGNIAVFSFLANVSQFPTINDDDYFFCTLPDGFLPQNMYFGGGHVSYFGSWKSGAFLRLRESGHVSFVPTIPFSEDFSFRGTISYFVE